MPVRTFGTGQRTTGEPFKIPVVVHIIHKGEELGIGSNLSEEQILSQIDVINEDFQRLNADTTLTPPEFSVVAGAVNIEFVLAKRDPLGNPSNGIIRQKGSKDIYNTVFDDEILKSESYWPAEDYLNIWVCDLNGENLGYAQFPDIDLPGLENEPKENHLTDGVVIDYKSFGSNNKGSFENLRVPYDKGRTATHEIGHFFGLLHVFASPGCSTDDHVEDTPLQDSDYKGCPTHPRSSCGSVDMFQNYMDYTDDACMNLFTIGQAERMQTVLDFAPRRGSLLDAIGAFPVDGISYDLAVNTINSPSLISCDTRFSPRITLQNMGTGAITRFAIEYGIDDETMVTDTVAIDSLKTGQQVLLPLRPIVAEEGQAQFFVSVNALDGEDFRSVNNTQKKLFVIDSRRDLAPYLQTFNSGSFDDILWSVISFDTDKTWEIEELGQGEGSAFINLHNYSANGAQDWLVSPVFDFSAYSEATLKFRVSHGKFEYLDSATMEVESYSDSLEVFVSSSCGTSFSRVYAGKSDDFKTGETDTYWEPSAADDWKEITLDISAYAGSPEVRLAFVSTSGYGNNIFIDDVELFVQSENEIVEIPENEIVVFPNPVRDNEFKLGFNTSERQDVHLQIYDIKGRLVQENYLANILNQVYTINFEGKKAGVYLAKIKGPTLNVVKKLIVSP